MVNKKNESLKDLRRSKCFSIRSYFALNVKDGQVLDYWKSQITVCWASSFIHDNTFVSNSH